MLRRTLFLYLFGALLFLKLVNLDIVHVQRQQYLQLFYQVDEKDRDPYTAILYLDYMRRLVPTNIEILKELAIYYLLINDPNNARIVLNQALCLPSANDKNRKALLKTYELLNKSEIYSCMNLW
jgi:hypothetical protein